MGAKAKESVEAQLVPRPSMSDGARINAMVTGTASYTSKDASTTPR